MAAITICLALTIGPSASGNEAANAGALPSAEVVHPSEVDPGLVAGRGHVRVAVLMASQPVLAVTSSSDFQRRLTGRVRTHQLEAARANPAEVTQRERARGARIARRHTNLIAGLADEGREAHTDQSAIVSAIEDAGGEVVDRREGISYVIARLPASALVTIADRADVQAVLPAPREKPQLSSSVPAVGAPSFWAAGYDGGEGANDVNSAIDVALGSEEPDPDAPGIRRRQRRQRRDRQRRRRPRHPRGAA